MFAATVDESAVLADGVIADTGFEGFRDRLGLGRTLSFECRCGPARSRLREEEPRLRRGLLRSPVFFLRASDRVRRLRSSAPCEFPLRFVSSLLRVGRDRFEIAVLHETGLPVAHHLLFPVFTHQQPARVVV